MSTISAASVNELRKRTDQPLMDCKKALTEAGGDMEKAIELLRAKNKNVTAKREGNETAEGRVGIVIDAATKTAAIVEFRCESAPTAKNERVVELVADLAKTVAEKNPTDVPALLATPFGAGNVQDRVNDVVGVIREKMIVHRFTRLSGNIYGQYVHHDGTVGVLIECKGTQPADEALRDICAHVAALNPPYLLASEVPADILAKEQEIAKQQILNDEKNVGKPANIIEKIAEGKLKTWLAETVLTEQQMANAMKYPGTTVSALLKKLGLEPIKVVRYKVGSVS